MIKVVDAAVQKAYGGKRKIHWMEVYAGEKATKVYGPDVWLPEETLDVVKDYVVSIKAADHAGGRRHPFAQRGPAPAAGPVCACARCATSRACSPVREPEKTDMVIFRENSEDIYAGTWPRASRPRN